jgi:putative nucleotidyltransferase with HDIG domain
MTGKDLTTIVADVKELPTLPQVAVTLMDLLDDPSSGASEINRVMARDPALASKILKLVNSAYYGLSNKVSSLNQAIVILGFKTVKSVALSASVMGLFKDHAAKGLFDRYQFWKHSIACACVARLVARKQRGLDPEAAFSAGLLHDIGKLVVDQYLPADMEAVIQAAQKGRLRFIEAEAAVFQTNHAEIGRWLADKWGLPKDLAGAIGFHHNMAAAPDRRLVAVLEFSNYLAKVKGLAASGSCETPEIGKEVWTTLAVQNSDLPELVNTINTEIEASASWLEVVT